MVFVILTSLTGHLEWSSPVSHVVDGETGASQGHTELMAKPILKFGLCFHSMLLVEIHELLDIRHLIL